MKIKVEVSSNVPTGCVLPIVLMCFSVVFFFLRGRDAPILILLAFLFIAFRVAIYLRTTKHTQKIQLGLISGVSWRTIKLKGQLMLFRF